MKALVIARREILEVLRNRKLMTAFLLQTLAVMLLLPAFSDFLAQGNLSLPVPSLSGFVSLAVVDRTGGEVGEVLVQDKRLSVEFLSALEEAAGHDGVLVAEEEEGRYFLELYIRQGVKKQLLFQIVREDISTLERRAVEKKLESVGLSTDPLIEVERSYLKEVVVRRGGEEYSSFFLAYLVPLVLLFPLFFSGSLVMDSVVGEKERRTFEPLVSSPIPRRDIVRGKFLGIWLLLSAQAAIWILFMKVVLSIPIASAPAAFIALSFLIALVVALAIFQAMLARNIKEANISMMVLYIILFILIIILLSIDFFLTSRVFEFLPVTLFARVISGGEFPFYAYPASMGLTGGLASVLLRASEKLMTREEAVFGGELNILSLGSSAIESFFSFFNNRRPLGIAVLLALVAPLSLTMGVFLGGISSFMVLFLLGYSNLSFVLIVLLSAFFEELSKLLALFPIKPRGWLGRKGFPIAGALAGMLFFSLESLVIGYLLEPYLAGSLYSLLTSRLFTTLLMHSLAGAAGGMWVGSGKLRYLGLAVLMHASFNLALVGGLP